jgi:hypothetical protein
VVKRDSGFKPKFHQKKKQKKKNHIIISTDAENVDKIQHAFMIKALKKIRTQG